MGGGGGGERERESRGQEGARERQLARGENREEAGYSG